MVSDLNYLYSRFKLPLNLHDTSISCLKINSEAASEIRSARLINYMDETTMAWPMLVY